MSSPALASSFALADYTQLLTRIAGRAREEHPSLPAAITVAELAEAQAQLGFSLHPLLAEVYQRIGNGGFGPDYQLLPLNGNAAGETAVSHYLAARVENAGTDWAWPEGVLPILTWGCAMYACVDCRSDGGMVLLFEPNPGDPDAAWYIDSPSLAEWFAHYINDTGWWIKAEEGEDLEDLPPWPRARARA